MKMRNILNSVWYSKFRTDLFLLWIIATCSLCVGLLLNQFRDQPLPLSYKSKAERLELVVSKIAEKAVSKSITSVALPKTLSLEEFRSYVEKNSGLILDARPEIFHRLGHVPGALSLAREDFEKDYTKLKNRLEKDKDQPLVVYCSSTSCEDSHLVQAALLKLGYVNVATFPGGWDAWTQEKLPVEVNP
jgi:rhodanese-related sulfurtransferase